MKNFTELKWLEILRKKTWITDEQNYENSVEELADAFNKNIEEALDEIAPYKTLTVNQISQARLQDSRIIFLTKKYLP